jgi:hypothetical protein
VNQQYLRGVRHVASTHINRTKKAQEIRRQNQVSDDEYHGFLPTPCAQLTGLWRLYIS